MNNKVTWIFGLLSIILVVVIIVLVLRIDRKKPEITFSDVDIIYSDDMDRLLLYGGITAFDEKDGDITDKIIIEKIVPSADGKSVSVTYAVNDSSNNFAKEVRVFPQRIKKAEEDIDTESDAEAKADTEPEESQDDAVSGKPPREEENSDENAGNAAEEQADETNEQADETNKNVDGTDENADETDENADGTDENADGTNENADENIAAPAEVNMEDGKAKSNPPTLELAMTEVTTKVGVRPAWVNVIKTLKDDKDSYETLYRNLVLNGDYKDGKEGDYDVTLRTSDSDGNKSVVCKLKIHVVK